MDIDIVLILWFVGSYILGSISFGDIVSGLRGVDIRSVGTGNPGAANVYREIGPVYGIAVFFIDVTKGLIVTIPIYVFGSIWMAVLGMLGVMVGHILPAPWRSSVGTGMALVMGSTLGLLPFGSLIVAVPTVAIMKVSKNAGYTGAFFFISASVVGWFLHGNVISSIAVLVAAISILVKSLIQYGNFNLLVRLRPRP